MNGKKILLFICLIVMAGCCLAIAGEGHGFGVDSKGYVYIGKDGQIEVFEDGQMIRSIKLPPHRAYYFTVQADDTILFSNSDFYYVLDLNGDVLSKKPEFESQIFNHLKMQREVVTENQIRYFYQNIFGCEIVKNNDGKIVYQTSLKNYFPLLMLSLMIICLCFPVVILITQHRKK